MLVHVLVFINPFQTNATQKETGKLISDAN